MPVYNEQASVRKVVNDWFQELGRNGLDFVLLAIDDGSTDSTPLILKSLQTEMGPRFEWMSRDNRGHGQTCLQGYRVAVKRKTSYVMQIDSDGQCDPQYFQLFWNLRNRFDVIYGKRTREDGIMRVMASIILRLLLFVRCGVYCVDPNVPYRLMKTQICSNALGGIPDNFHLANVALAVLLKKEQGIRHGFVPIRFRERIGGKPSVPFSRFAVKAMELCRQLKMLMHKSSESVPSSSMTVSY